MGFAALLFDARLLAGDDAPRLFSTFLGWFPSGGYSTPNADITGVAHVVDVLNHLFLPMVTLTLGYLGSTTS
jgi:peptide/nickel transport system permease protein